MKGELIDIGRRCSWGDGGSDGVRAGAEGSSRSRGRSKGADGDTDIIVTV